MLSGHNYRAQLYVIRDGFRPLNRPAPKLLKQGFPAHPGRASG